MSSNQRNYYCFFDFHTARGVLVKPKLTKNKMGFNETKCNNIEIKNKSAILNGTEEKQKLFTK
jgi:hypothetical protein